MFFSFSLLGFGTGCVSEVWGIHLLKRCCCSLKVWQLGSSSPNFTLEGHEKGVNCIDYYSGGDKPYLISGADDRLVKIWDYQVKFFHNLTCHMLDTLLTVSYRTVKTWVVELCSWHNNLGLQYFNLNCGPRILH